MYGQDALRRIRAVVPDVKLIAILRDPTVRAYSHYRIMWRRGIERLSFPEAIDAELSQAAGVRRGSHPSRPYLGYGHYEPALRRIVDMFGQESLRVCFLEDLFVEPSQSVSAIEEFILGYGHSDGEPIANCLPHENRFSGGESNLFARLVLTLSRHTNGRHTGFLGRAIRQYNCPPLLPHTIQRLQDHFEESNARLANFLGRALPYREHYDEEPA